MEEKEFLRKVGFKIKILRELNNWSQETLAEKADVSQPYFGTVERGEQNPSLTLLKKIADALEVDIRELFNFII